jgi:hypothetical protein
MVIKYALQPVNFPISMYTHVILKLLVFIIKLLENGIYRKKRPCSYKH